MDLRRHRDLRRRGIATIWMVFSIIGLFAFLTLVVNIQYVACSARQLSAGADAAALAGALYLRQSQVTTRDRAVLFAGANTAGDAAIAIDRNDANNAVGDVVIGRYRRATRTFTATLDDPNAVRVRARRTTGSTGGPLALIMASLTGSNSAEVDREAIAMIYGDVGPAIIALNPTAPCALDMRGSSGLIQVENGAVVVDSTNAEAACRSGDPTLDVGELHVVGGVEPGFENSVTGELFTGVEPVPDPLAALPEPNPPAVNHGKVKVNQNQTVTLQPGVYTGLEINGGTVTMAPGLYYMTGEFKYNGGVVDGTAGVMIFLAPGGWINVAGNGSFRIAGMSPTVYPNGPAVPASVANIPVPIFQSRSNALTAELNGTADWLIGGTIYLPEAKILLRGTPGTFANGLIADTIETRGTENLVIDYVDQFPPLPRFVFLVE